MGVQSRVRLWDSVWVPFWNIVGSLFLNVFLTSPDPRELLEPWGPRELLEPYTRQPGPGFPEFTEVLAFPREPGFQNFTAKQSRHLAHDAIHLAYENKHLAHTEDHLIFSIQPSPSWNKAYYA